MEPVATTTAGQVRGREKNGILLFAGMPYAASTAGPNRFRPPQPVEPWEGVRDATRFGKVAPQPGDALAGVIAAPPPDWSEDCLFVNVQTPALDGARRPVLVWIHGGAFKNGTGAIPWYDGHHFVTHGDVVAVTINYRLGPFGWLYLGGHDPEYQSSANNGLLDQIAALEWVRDNIASFGGNPDDVTIFGESAGGMSVATLLGTPKAKGLFHKAIPQSGAAHNVWDTSVAQQVTDAVFEAAGVSSVDQLIALDGQQLIAAAEVADLRILTDRVQSNSATWGTSFAPIVDGEVLPEPPLDAVRAGLNADVPLLVGTTLDEWNLFAMGLPSPEDEETIARRVSRAVPDADKLLAAYRTNDEGLPRTPHEIWSAIMTDRVFRVPAIRLAEAQSRHQPANTFMYRFDWPTPSFDGRLGACHSLEIPFVFDNLTKPGVEVFAGPNPPQPLADAMHAAWIAFARTGDPNEGSGLDWPAYEPAGHRTTMIFHEQSEMEDDPAPDERVAWDGVL